MTDATVVAIDLAFPLPEPLSSIVIAINQRMLPPPAGFRFDATHLPHLTLVQQFVRRTALGQVRRVVAEAVSGCDAPPLVTTDVRVGRVACTLRVAQTAELSALHRRLLDVLAPFQTATAGPGPSLQMVTWLARPTPNGWSHFDSSLRWLRSILTSRWVSVVWRPPFNRCAFSRPRSPCSISDGSVRAAACYTGGR